MMGGVGAGSQEASAYAQRTGASGNTKIDLKGANPLSKGIEAQDKNNAAIIQGTSMSQNAENIKANMAQLQKASEDLAKSQGPQNNLQTLLKVTPPDPVSSFNSLRGNSMESPIANAFGPGPNSFLGTGGASQLT